MAKSSPGRTSFNAGEFSELVQGRVDLDRYAASMRQMLNFVAVPQGPAVRRSGTAFVTPVRDETNPAGLIPFEFSDVQLSMLEFSNGRMRVLSDDGVLQGPDGGAYSIQVPYVGDAVRRIRALQSDDVVYLFCDGYPVHKLARFDATDWRISVVELKSGPFMPIAEQNGVLSFNGTGNRVPVMTSNTAPSGRAFTADNSPTAYLAFDGNPNTQVAIAGFIGYEFPEPVRFTSYILGSPSGVQNDQSIPSIDYTPFNFSLEGSNDGTNYAVLDTRTAYVAYENGFSEELKFSNSNRYKFYRLVSADSRRAGVPPRISSLTFVEPPQSTSIIVGLAGTDIALNQGRGFLSTDAGRLIRVRSQDRRWRVLRITGVETNLRVNATLEGPPLNDTQLTAAWQIGYFGDTLGHPTVGTFFEDRLWLSGIAGAPTLVAGSVVGDYENFETRTSADEVLDDSALALLIKARKQSRTVWLDSDERGLLIGTGSSEWVVNNGGSNEPFNARNGRARASTERGSANVAPAKVDRQILYVQKSKRTVREFAYVYEADGYKSPSMSLFASHLGVKRFEQMAYASEPHSIVWIRREDGSVVGLTYNREENVIGWHRHDFGGEVESIATLPSRDGLQDTLWMTVRRTVNGRMRRYVEKLTRFWDFDSVVQEAHFVDCALRYDGPVTASVSGLAHLENEVVAGLADGVPFEDRVVAGRITLREPASDVVVGLPYESFGEIARLEVGAADGTAQGKTKRIHNASVSLWDSARGEIGVFNEDQKEYDWTDVEYEQNFTDLEPIELQTGITGPHIVGGGYGKDGTLAFRQRAPLPFNVVAVLPQMNTQDR